MFTLYVVCFFHIMPPRPSAKHAVTCIYADDEGNVGRGRAAQTRKGMGRKGENEETE